MIRRRRSKAMAKRSGKRKAKRRGTGRVGPATPTRSGTPKPTDTSSGPVAGARRSSPTKPSGSPRPPKTPGGGVQTPPAPGGGGARTETGLAVGAFEAQTWGRLSRLEKRREETAQPDTIESLSAMMED